MSGVPKEHIISLLYRLQRYAKVLCSFCSVLKLPSITTCLKLKQVHQAISIGKGSAILLQALSP